jgi:putative ABC transport system permease protein
MARDSPKVMIINETMARRFWPNQDPIGQHVTMEGWGPPLTGEVVGISGDVRLDGLDLPPAPAIHWPYTQFPSIFNSVVIRAAGDPRSLLPMLKSQVWSVAPEQTIAEIRTMDEIESGTLTERRFNTSLLGGFALVALVLAAIGIYGVMAYSVTQRARELGIRIALGAQSGDVVRMVAGWGARLTTLGLGIGLAVAFFATRLMAGLLYGVTPRDPWSFVTVSLVLAAVALAACYLPARRAARVDPIAALRHE